MLANSACKAKGKIQATKCWLNRAEEHFNKDASVRGQLDLLLAEAELKSSRESFGDRSAWFRLNWIQQTIAFSLAAILLVAGMSGAWWWHSTTATKLQQSSIAPTLPLAPILSVPLRSISTAPATTGEKTTVVAVETTISAQEVKRTENSTTPETAVSPDEMKRLIQTAGQTLRGRSK